MQAVTQGLSDIEAGHEISFAEVKKRLKRPQIIKTSGLARVKRPDS